MRKGAPSLLGFWEPEKVKVPRKPKVKRIATPTAILDSSQLEQAGSEPFVAIVYKGSVDVLHHVWASEDLARSCAERRRSENLNVEVMSQSEYFVHFRAGKFALGKYD